MVTYGGRSFTGKWWVILPPFLPDLPYFFYWTIPSWKTEISIKKKGL
jgi:hypothetical protein